MAEIRKEIGWDDGTGQVFEVASESPGPSSFSVTSPENLSISEREKSFVVRTTNRQPALLAVVRVRQEAPPVRYVLTLYVVDGTDIGPEGGSREIFAVLMGYINDTRISYEEVVPDISVIGVGFYSIGTLVYARNRTNDNGDRRSCDVAGEYEVPGYGIVTGSFIIYQASNYFDDGSFYSLAVKLIKNSDTFTSSGGTLNILSYVSDVLVSLKYPSGYDATVSVKSDAQLYLEADSELPSWLSFDSSGNGVVVSENEGEERSARIRVCASYRDLKDYSFFNISQDGTTSHSLSVNPSSFSFSAEGGSLIIRIESDENWTIT